MSTSTLKYSLETSDALLKEVMDRSGQNLMSCYQCRRCAAGCPVGEESGVTPDRLVRMVLLGEKENALNNLLIWKCVACYTCGTRCPNSIQTSRINETLKQMAKERHIEPNIPRVASFHSSFVKSIAHFGRSNELEFMALYEIENFKKGGLTAVKEDIKNTSKLGRAMLTKKRMHFKLDRTKGKSEIKGLFNKAAKKRGVKG
ncbi:MAG: heterodisulfide reductase subunit C-like protein [Nitrospiraceae bacterium]|nr:MAG: heterodisulfide reductase subunit C-like protein [Nitrospiraceae bacterium]